MDWYYLRDTLEVGPFIPADMRRMYEDGLIHNDTQVRTADMTETIPLHQAMERGLAQELELVPKTNCPTCPEMVSTDELIPMGEVMLCPACRDDYLQRMREGVGVDDLEMTYATFGIRFGGYLIDTVIMYVYGIIIGLAFSSILVDMETGNVNTGMMVLFYLLSYGVPLLYAVFFLGHPKFQATPGMMLVKIRIIKKDGSNCTYLLALGRYFAAILSALILLVGYFMCLWDKKRQTLHDRICGPPC